MRPRGPYRFRLAVCTFAPTSIRGPCPSSASEQPRDDVFWIIGAEAVSNEEIYDQKADQFLNVTKAAILRGLIY